MDSLHSPTFGRAGARSTGRLPVFLGLLAASLPASSLATGTWQTTLQPRDFDLDGTVDGYYDTVRDITWLADGNALAGTAFDIGSATNPSTTDGLTDWLNARAWVDQLRVAGVGGWRLPSALDTGTPGCNFTFFGTDCGASPDTEPSELAHLFFVTLGNQSQVDANGAARPSGTWGLQNVGPFRQLLPAPYWSGGQSAQSPPRYFFFFMFNGVQFDSPANSLNGYAIAVRDGDTPDGSGVNHVPWPAWVGLMAPFLLAFSAVRFLLGRDAPGKGLTRTAAFTIR